MAKTITISFKETAKDMKLFTFVDSLDDKSGWVKDAISAALIKEERRNNKNNRGI